MKPRWPSPRPPPIVEIKKSKRAALPPAAAPPPPAAPSATKTSWLQSEVNVWVNRLRMANDPAVSQRAAEKLAQRDEAENAMVSIIALPHHPLGAGFLLIAKGGAYGALERALRALFALINFVRQPK